MNPQNSKPLAATCPDCGTDLVRVRDMDTGELLWLNTQQVDDGRVRVFAAGGAALARRFGQPCRTQPAWRVHDCPTGADPASGAPTDSTDPYEDVPAGLQQAGWRQP